MVKKVLIFWRDIPSQVIVQRGRRREKVVLGARFQEAIDRAAMRAGKGGSDAYLAEWRRETTTTDAGGDLREIALAEAGRFEDEFTRDRLDALIRSHGVAPDGGRSGAPQGGRGAARDDGRGGVAPDGAAGP